MAYFVIGLGIGSAFMPLLTIAMANVPAAEAGLASGIVNVSQQVAGALGLAVLGTIATSTAPERSRRPTIRPSPRRSAGDHLAFAIGATAVAAGLLVAFSVLRRSRPREQEVVAQPEIVVNREFASTVERQAA